MTVLNSFWKRGNAQAGLAAITLILVTATTNAQEAKDGLSAPVGMQARLESLVLPGSELVAKPLDDRKLPLVVRIVSSYPHGTAHRYDIVYYGLEPGQYNLCDYLLRKDGTSTDDLPETLVTIVATLPAGQMEPNSLQLDRELGFSSYQWKMILAGIIWVVGLAIILCLGQKKQQKVETAEQAPLTMADFLRPIIEDAAKGEITKQQQAQLERILLACWRKRLQLTDVSAAEAIQQLRQHPEAGQLLLQLEQWLHREDNSQTVDVNALLEPYRDLPSDLMEVDTTLVGEA